MLPCMKNKRIIKKKRIIKEYQRKDHNNIRLSDIRESKETCPVAYSHLCSPFGSQLDDTIYYMLH